MKVKIDPKTGRPLTVAGNPNIPALRFRSLPEKNPLPPLTPRIGTTPAVTNANNRARRLAEIMARDSK